MNTYSIDISSIHRPDELVRFFEDNELKQGDTLKIITKEDKTDFVMMAVMVVLSLALLYFFGLKKKREEDGEQILGDLFKGKSVEEIEREIEDDLGIKIEVEHKEDEEQNAWRNISAQNFLKAYEENEPDYYINDIKEPNPLYESKWKGK